MKKMNLANAKQLSRDEMKKLMGGSQCGDTCSGGCTCSTGSGGSCRASDAGKCYCACGTTPP